MRPLPIILMILACVVWIIAAGWLSFTGKKERLVKAIFWPGLLLSTLFIRDFADDVGPLSWADVADWISPEGYAHHSVDASISVQQNWLVGETKECNSVVLDSSLAQQLGKEPGYVAEWIKCDDGPKHTITVNLYGRLNQPEHRIAYWRCTREAEGFTCRQTGAE